MAKISNEAKTACLGLLMEKFEGKSNYLAIIPAYVDWFASKKAKSDEDLTLICKDSEEKLSKALDYWKSKHILKKSAILEVLSVSPLSYNDLLEISEKARELSKAKVNERKAELERIRQEAETELRSLESVED